MRIFVAIIACLPSFAIANDIAFTSFHDDRVWINVLHGSTVERIQTALPYAEAPTWFPHGKRLAFHGRQEKTAAPDIYVVNATNGEVVRLTDHEARDEFPAVSPDGKSIAFMSTRDYRDDGESIWKPSDKDIFVMTSDGSGVRRLTAELRGTEFPAWSPDGRCITFSAAPKDKPPLDGVPTAQFSAVDIHVASIDGSIISRVTSLGATCLHPSWSPDGKQIAFASNAHNDSRHLGDLQIYVVQADGKKLRQVTHLEGQNIYPRWSPNGRRILFYANTPDPHSIAGRTQLVTVDLQDGKTEIMVVAGAPAYYPAWKPLTANRQLNK